MNLPIFDPPNNRSLQSLLRFLRACKLEAEKPTGVVPVLPKVLTGGHMVQVGEPARYLFEVVIIRDSENRCFGLYMPAPPDLRTLLPELNVVDLARSRGRLTHGDGRQVSVSALSVDEVSHLIVLAQGPDQLDDDVEDIEIIFDDE